MARIRKSLAPTDTRPFQLAKRCYRGLRKLRYANDAAVDCGGSAADFAVGIADLIEIGMDKSDILWLMQKGLLDRYVENDVLQRQKVTHLPSHQSLRLGDTSWFFLTPAGVAFAQQHLSKQPTIIEKASCIAAMGPIQSQVAPVWDPFRRTLSFNSTVIRRFTQRKSAQVQIVIAFHEQGFAVCLDDPLPPSNGVDPKERLSKAVRRLSESIHPALIRFECNSDHTAVRWHEVTPPGPAQHAPQLATNGSHCIV